MFGQDLIDPALYENGFPHRLFTGIRRDCPVAWHDPDGTGPVTDGFWSIAGYHETVTVLEQCELLSPPATTVIDDAVALSLLELAMSSRLLERVRALGVGVASVELARWVCPRTVVWCRATDELVLGRHRVAAGERLACWLPSANRDQLVFGRDGMLLLIDRPDNPHLSFVGIDDGAERFADALDAALADAVAIRLVAVPEFLRSVERAALTNVPFEVVTA